MGGAPGRAVRAAYGDGLENRWGGSHSVPGGSNPSPSAPAPTALLPAETGLGRVSPVRPCLPAADRTCLSRTAGPGTALAQDWHGGCGEDLLVRGRDLWPTPSPWTRSEGRAVLRPAVRPRYVGPGRGGLAPDQEPYRAVCQRCHSPGCVRLNANSSSRPSRLEASVGTVRCWPAGAP